MLSNNKQNKKNVLVTAHSKPAIPFSRGPLDIRLPSQDITDY